MTDRTISMPVGIRSDIDLVSNVMERAGSESAWSNVYGFSEAATELQQQLEQAFPNGPNEMLDLMSDGAGDRLSIGLDDDLNEIEVIGSNMDDTGIDTMKRIFDLRKNNLELRCLYLLYDARGTGKGIKILLGTYEVARRLGMKTMTLKTDDLGCYVWARAGFLPKTSEQWYKVSRSARTRLNWEKFSGHSDFLMAAHDILGKSKPRAIWDLADLNYKIDGKKAIIEIMYGIKWNGSFTVGDPEQEARLKEYAKSRGA